MSGYLLEEKNRCVQIWQAPLTYDEFCRRLGDAQIARVPSARTLKRWLRAIDPPVAAKSGIITAYDAEEDATSTDKLVSRLQQLRVDILDVAVSHPFISAEGAIISLKRVQAMLDGLKASQNRLNHEDIMQLANLVFSVLYDDAVIGGPLREREYFIIREIEARINEK